MRYKEVLILAGASLLAACSTTPKQGASGPQKSMDKIAAAIANVDGRDDRFGMIRDHRSDLAAHMQKDCPQTNPSLGAITCRFERADAAHYLASIALYDAADVDPEQGQPATNPHEVNPYEAGAVHASETVAMCEQSTIAGSPLCARAGIIGRRLSLMADIGELRAQPAFRDQPRPVDSWEALNEPLFRMSEAVETVWMSAAIDAETQTDTGIFELGCATRQELVIIQVMEDTAFNQRNRSARQLAAYDEFNERAARLRLAFANVNADRVGLQVSAGETRRENDRRRYVFERACVEAFGQSQVN